MLRIATWTLGKIADAVGGEVRGDQNARVSSVSSDTRTIEEGALFVALRGERFDAHDFVEEAIAEGAAAALVSVEDAVPDGTPSVVVDDTLAGLQALGAALWSEADAGEMSTVALTGSNGKTTTKELLAALWSTLGIVHATPGNLNNHIGLPLTLCALPASCDVAVLEMGCNDFGEISELVRMAPGEVRVITSIGLAHIERLGSLDGVRRAKSEIFEDADEETLAVIPASEADELPLDGFPGRVITVGFSEDADVRMTLLAEPGSATVEVAFEGSSLRVHSPLPGKHNAHNLGTALATMLGRGVSPDPERIDEALAGMTLPGGRWRVRRRDDYVFIDDAYNANPTSTRASYEAFLEIGSGGADVDPTPRVAIIGEMLELGAEAERLHAETAAWIAARGGVDRLVVVGPHAEAMARAARAVAVDTEVAARATVEETADYLRRLGGGTIFLKASRGMELERVIDLLEEDEGRQA